MLPYLGYGDTNAWITTAITSNLWAEYNQNRNQVFNEDNLKFILMGLHEGICSHYQGGQWKTVDFGVLRPRPRQLVQHIEEPSSKQQQQ